MDSKINPLIFLYIYMDKGGHTVVLNGGYSIVSKINRGRITVLRGGDTVSLNLYGVVSVFQFEVPLLFRERMYIWTTG